jgi:SdrD B-like domain
MAQLNGNLYLDLNGNGSIDSGDTGAGLDGWTVFIDVDGSGSFTSGDISGTTDSSGAYTITSIPLGTYGIGVLDDSGNTFLTTFPGAANDYYLSNPTGTVTFTRGAVDKTINFETSSQFSLTDNLSITASRQPWLNEGFRFWTDNNNNNRLDGIENTTTSTLFLERTNPTNATDSGFGFVNDRSSGPFGPGRRLVYDREQTAESGQLGTFFLRGGGLYTNSTVVTFLLEYTSPAVSGSGTLWDIDTTWNELTQGLSEEWKVEFLSATDTNNDGQLENVNVLGSLISPKGQPVWVPNTTADIATYEAKVAAADRPLALQAHNASWLYNPNSLDARAWEWSFDRPQADVNFVRISFTGNKTLNSDVGFAFDNFKTYKEDIESRDFGVYELATIGDKVFSDNDGDGLQGSGENGVEGVTVTLLDENGNSIGTDITDANGEYSFAVAPGTYSVEFSNLPSGFTGFSPADQGDDTLDSDANPGTGRTGSVTVESGETNNTLDAGLIPDAGGQPGASIGDYVWLDTDFDGIQDSNEVGINGVYVELLDTNGNLLQSTSTFNNGLTDGYYRFESLNPSTYVVRFTQPEGYSGFSPGNQGLNDDIDSDALANGETAPITVGVGQSIDNIDAGLTPLLVLGNRFWEDLNGNGLQDNNEPGIVGAEVKLLDSNNNVVATATGENGIYNFNVAPGTYQVQFVPSIPFQQQPHQFTQANQGDDTLDSDVNPVTGISNPITLTTSNNNTIDAGIYRLATLGNRVWADTDRDGVQDPNELGISGVTVNLLDSNNAQIGTTTTNNNGNYSFQVAPGSYKVEFIQPASGYASFTTANQGSEDSDSDAGTNGITELISVISGEFNDKVDAGLLPELSPGDRVWNDANQNGLQDTNESGIAGITVNLLDSSNTVIETTTTNSSGIYTFSVDPGTYSVQFAPNPSLYGFTRPNIGGNDGNDSDADPLTGITQSINLTTANNFTLDAGLYVRPSVTEGWTPADYISNTSRFTGSGYATSSNYETVFGITLNDSLKTAVGNGDATVTFLEALNFTGNDLLRQSTAALLNASLGQVDYYYSIGEVFALTKAAFTNGNPTVSGLASAFASYNDDGVVI